MAKAQEGQPEAWERGLEVQEQGTEFKKRAMKSKSRGLKSGSGGLKLRSGGLNPRAGGGSEGEICTSSIEIGKSLELVSIVRKYNGNIRKGHKLHKSLETQ